MTYTYKQVSNPRYSTADNRMIDVEVYFDHIGETVTFSACATDSEPHGRDIFARAVAGEYGPIAVYKKS